MSRLKSVVALIFILLFSLIGIINILLAEEKQVATCMWFFVLHCRIQLDILFLFTGRNLDKETIKEVFLATVRGARGNS